MNDQTSASYRRRHIGGTYPGRVAAIRIGVVVVLLAVMAGIMYSDGHQGRWALLLLIPAAANLWFIYHGLRRARSEHDQPAQP